MMLGTFELKHVGDKGVGLFAVHPYEENEIIFEEKPLMAAQFCWNEAYGYAACHHCMKPLETTEENVRRLTGDPSIVLPYPELCQTTKENHRFCDACCVGFCSEACKQIALSQYHRYLCPSQRPELTKLIESWKVMHYPPETTSITLILKILATIESAADKNYVIRTLLEFCHGAGDADGSCMKILGPSNAERLATLQNEILKSMNLTSAEDLVRGDGLVKTFSLVGRNGQGIGTSVFSEWVRAVDNLNLSGTKKEEIDNFVDATYEAMDNHVGTFLNCEGSGLYKLQRCLNHSCDPNASVTFPYSNFEAVIKTSRAIEAGEEICISYMDECNLGRSRHSRRKILREFYLFDCSCEKCLCDCDEEDVTSESEDEEMDT